MPIPTGSSPTAAQAQHPRGAAGLVFMLGLLPLLGALGASLAMVTAKLGGIALPGCGGGSDCDRVANGPWGTVPPKLDWIVRQWPEGLYWPVSYLGFAYFAGLLIGWIRSRGVVSPGLRWLVRAGGVGSLVFIGVMLYEHLLCKYCLAAHVCNLLFVVLCEASAGRSAGRGPASRGLIAASGVFALASAGLGLVEAQTTRTAKGNLQQSVNEMVRNAQASHQAPTGPTGGTGATGTTGAPAATAAAVQVQPAPTGAAEQPRGFTGRFRKGPERAAIRVVMITDYQCPDCKNQEALMRSIMGQRQDVSLSVKHFPFCTDCNRTPGLTNIHPNACWAARAAETAGALYGSDGFWKMHEWLFNVGGGFTTEAFNAALAQMGFDRNRFVTVMQSEASLKGISADIQEAVALGIQRTPMIFINGVELKNWNVDPQALPKAVAALAAANPAPAGSERDRPPNAGDKYVDDWRDLNNHAMAWPERARSWTSVDQEAPVRIQIFGDFLEPDTAEADRTVREACAGRDDIRYEFRYYPIDPACNPDAPKFRPTYPGGCRAARAAEAAGQLWGADAYWAMHIWLMSHQSAVRSSGDEAIRAGATELKLDPGALIAKMDSPEIASVVDSDANIGVRIGMTGIPAVFINGKRVPRWKLPGGFVLERIIEEAATKPGK